jgi:hypothetical protein
VLASILFFFEKKPNRGNDFDSSVGDGRILAEPSFSLGYSGVKPRVTGAAVLGDSAEPWEGLGDTVLALGIPNRDLVSTLSAGRPRFVSNDDWRLCADAGRLFILLCTTGDFCCTKISGAPSLLGRLGGTVAFRDSLRGDECTR